jgi:DNA-binding XRE family transcriptional regulator
MALRINNGWSREQLAWRIGVSRETIRLTEAGFVPTPRIQFAIAEAFGRRPLDLWPLARQRSGR